MKHHQPKLQAVKNGTTVSKPPTRAYPTISKHVTPSDFRTAFRAAQSGNPGHLFQILEFFYKLDDEIPAAMQSLKSALLSEPFVITPQDENDNESLRQQEVFEHLFERLDIQGLADELLDGHFYGFSAVNIPPEAWEAQTVDGRTYQLPTTYEVIPREWIYAKKEEKSDDWNTIYIGDEPYYTYAPGSVMLFSQKKLPSYKDIDFTSFGTGVACIRLATFKYFDYEDWAAFNEVFATPLILGKVGPGGDRDTVQKAVNEMGNAARATVNDGDTIEFPQSNQPGSVDAFERFSENLSKGIAKIIKSESLTDNMGSSGSYAAMYTTNGIRVDVAKKLRRQLMQILRRRFILPIVEMNFGGKILVDIDLHIEGVEDQVQEVRVIDTLLKHMDGSAKHIRNKFNFPAPDSEDEEDTISRQNNAATFGF
ncbi:phage portal protein family protein [Thiohalophilus sp.]|uniref:phage portal protein family protein n=1 Tax=Thiohalophilus sp. TaxID=3028392 RepID=UPI002ACEF0D0|nr:DUF935 family protein [Thiohalophilus sp.]MDZ7802378.1 DUF935 family protein [Thiohalophilus sp.]